MFYIPKIDDYLKIMTDEKVKDFVTISFSECFKSIRKEENLGKVTKSVCIFLTTTNEVENCVKSSSSDNCIHQYWDFEYFWSRITTD